MTTPQVPDIYEHDMRQVVTILDTLKVAMDEHNSVLADAYIPRMEVFIESGNGYPIGALNYSDEQWRFTPYADWAES